MLPGRLESWLHQTSCIITKTLVMRIECLVVKQSDSDIIRQQLDAYFLPVGYGSPRAGGVGWSECPALLRPGLAGLPPQNPVCPFSGLPAFPHVAESLHSAFTAFSVEGVPSGK